jgi:hypothetical protein
MRSKEIVKVDDFSMQRSNTDSVGLCKWKWLAFRSINRAIISSAVFTDKNSAFPPGSNDATGKCAGSNEEANEGKRIDTV